MTAILEARGLTKTYKIRARGKDAPTTVEAVKGVDITVNAGEIVGFLGPNGAGKTTTLAHDHHPARPHGRHRHRRGRTTSRATPSASAGASATWPRWAPPTRRPSWARSSSTTPSSTASTPASPPSAARRCSPISTSTACGRASAARSRAASAGGSTSPWASSTSRTWCSSTSRRPGSTRSRAPTCGTTSRACATTTSTTVFITTHYMDEADALCDRILIIDHGEIVAEGTPEELKRRVGGDQVTLTVAPDDADRTVTAAAGLVADSHPEADGGEVRLVSADGGRALPALLARLGQGRHRRRRASRSGGRRSTTSSSPSPGARYAMATEPTARACNF